MTNQQLRSKMFPTESSEVKRSIHFLRQEMDRTDLLALFTHRYSGVRDEREQELPKVRRVQNLVLVCLPPNRNNLGTKSRSPSDSHASVNSNFSSHSSSLLSINKEYSVRRLNNLRKIMTNKSACVVFYFNGKFRGFYEEFFL